MRIRPGRVQPAKVAAVAAALCVAVTACGSNVAPETVAQANGQYGAASSQGAVPGEEPGTVTGADPGTSAADGGDGSLPGSGPGADGAGDDTAADTPGGGTDQPKPPVSKVASCDGFDNDQPGVTSDKIVVANASDISGPVPGLFESAQQGTKAFFSYFNATTSLCGHEIEVLALDSRAEGGADQQAYTKACSDSFAAVGSMSSFDSGGARTAEECGLPDLRSTTVTPERRACSTCFSAQSVSPNLVPSSMPKYWLGKEREATQHVALLYVNVGAAKVNSESFKVAWERSGWKIDYFEGIDTSEFNYTPYVQAMKDRDIDFVVYAGPYQFTIRLQEAMQQQSFEPAVFLQDSTIYDAAYVEQAGEVGNGSHVYSTTALFDDYSIAEMKLYRDWLRRVSPDAEPNMYGLYAWSASRLFAEQAAALGGRLNRETLVAALSKVRNWTGNGVHAPQQVGARTTANCIKIFRLNDARWSQVSPGDYMCGPLIDTKVGG